MNSFTTDWVTGHEAIWKQVLNKFAGQPSLRALEIGVYEGRSSLWFLSHILTHPTATIVCIDPYCKPVFHQNIALYAKQATLIEEPAQKALRTQNFAPEGLHFIYIDGDHKARAVLEIAVLCFRLLKKGGIIIFDDYFWKSPNGDDELLNPKIAIDCFLKIFKGQYTLLNKGRQVILERTIKGRL